MSTRVYWSPSESAADVETERQLDEELDRITRTCVKLPAVVFITRADGNRMAIGLGYSDWSFLEFFAAGGRRFSSAVPRLATGSANVNRVFYLAGEYSEIPARALMPVSVARAIVREFFTTGKLSETVDWKPGGRG
jgi:hypothetical protein